MTAEVRINDLFERVVWRYMEGKGSPTLYKI